MNGAGVAAGPFRAQLDGTDLRFLRHRGVEVCRRLYVAVRDTAWGTVPGRVEVLDRAETDAGLRLAWCSDHRSAGVPFVWRGSLALRPDGLRLDVEGEALDDLSFNRIGACVLHPLRQAGGRVRLEWASQTAEAELPLLVAPQRLVGGGPSPALGPFRALTIDDGARTTQWAFSGDDFELEDQRNWTDASFKTYSTPLALPRPRRLPAGGTLRQSVTLRVLDAASPPPSPLPPVAPAPTLRLSALLQRWPDHTPTRADLAALVRAGFTHVRLEARPDAASADGVRGLAQWARSAGAGVELTLLVDADAPPERLRGLVADIAPDLALVYPAAAVSGSEAECTPPELLAAARHALAGLLPPEAVGGGTPFNFCVLQRHPLEHLDPAAFALCPTVHADDPTSIRETTEAAAPIMATLRTRAGGVRVAVGPILSRERPPATIGREPAPASFDASALPEDWLRDVVRAWRGAGADRICTLDVRSLVRDGRLTAAAAAILRGAAPLS